VLDSFPRNEPYLIEDVRGSIEKWHSSNAKQIVTPDAGQRFNFIARLEKLFVVFPTYFLFLEIPLKGKIHAISFCTQIL